MSDESANPVPGASHAKGILVLVAAVPMLGLALFLLAGPIVAVVATAILGTSLGMTILAERKERVSTLDPGTGLPDRAAALQRLDEILGQRIPGSAQAAVVVISITEVADATIPPTDRQPITILAATRLAQGLRKGDQIVRIGGDTLAAILGPSRNLTAPAAERILQRIDRMFVEPLRIGSRTVPAQVSLGACLQHDAPRADAPSWLDAAELAAEVAAEVGRPQLFPSGAIKVDRAAWAELETAALLETTEDDDATLWRNVERRTADDPASARSRARSRSA